ncbi:hypothetical protein P8452_59677 [Trifolium repens]|nr:hypothetical protein P8452_59677 [Trifolium repens]
MISYQHFQPTNQIAAVTAFLILPPFHVTSTISLSLSLSLSLLGVSICGTVPNSILQQSEAFHFDWIGLDWIGSQKAIYILPFFSPQR